MTASMKKVNEPSAHECLPWAELLEYERADAVCDLLKMLTANRVFAKDRLRVVEREEWQVAAAGHSDVFCMDSLMLTGHVGHLRRDAVTAIVRDWRLRRVRDLVTAVTTGYVAGDTVPSFMLEPLEVSAPVLSYRRWYRARCAMQAGLLHKIEERREHTRNRLRALLSVHSAPSRSGGQEDSTSLHNGSGEDTGDDTCGTGHTIGESGSPNCEAFSTASSTTAHSTSGGLQTRMTSMRTRSRVASPHEHTTGTGATAMDDNFECLFSQKASSSRTAQVEGGTSTVAEPPAEEETQRQRDERHVAEMKRLAVFEAGAKETRVDMRALAASVPTVFIAWSYRHEASMAWLREHLFNDKAVRELDTINGGVPQKFAVLFGVDPWLRFVEKHTSVPPRRQPDEKLQQQKVLPITSKRAQIVLINVDLDQDEALRAYKSLRRLCEGWCSQEVSLMALWSGPEGLQGSFCGDFNVTDFPFLIVTSPMRRNLRDYRLVRPQITSLVCGTGTTSVVADAHAVVEDDDAWSRWPRQKRQELCERLVQQLVGREDGGGYLRQLPSIPLRFTSHVERAYYLLNPHAKTASKAVRAETTSGVTLSGLLSESDLHDLSGTLLEFLRFRDFAFRARVMRPSGSVFLRLDPATPEHIVQGVQHAVTCASCATSVNVDVEAHFYCLHCAAPQDGTLCEACAHAHITADPLEHLFSSSSQNNKNGSSGSHGTCEQLPPRARATTLLWEDEPPLSPDAPPVPGPCKGPRARHPLHHLFLRLPPLTEKDLVQSERGKVVCTRPLLWGPCNVNPLPRFRGQLIVNKAREHIGVYCSGCRRVVKGTRWKCAVCYDCDLCERCFDVLYPGLCGTQHLRKVEYSVRVPGHATWHPLLCVPFAIDGDASAILNPEFIADPVKHILCSKDDTAKGC